MMKWVKLKESTKSINTARVIIHSLLTSIFFYLLFAGTSIAAQQAPTIELEEIRSDEEFYAWLNSEAPIQWLERYFPESRSWLREANTIIDFYSRAIRLFTMKHIPNPPTVYSVCYPIIGSDFVTPFLFGASNCLSCDAAPLLKSKKSLEADIFNIFKPFIPAIESSEKECLHLFLALLGFNHPYVPREDFSSPTGYLAMFRLKLLLQAEDIQVTSLSKEQFKITFSKPEIYGRYSLIYFNQTNILGTSENAVKSQIYIALICYLLLELLRRNTCKSKHAFSNFVERIRICLAYYLSLDYVCNHVSQGAKSIKAEEKPPDLFSHENTMFG